MFAHQAEDSRPQGEGGDKFGGSNKSVFGFHGVSKFGPSNFVRKSNALKHWGSRPRSRRFARRWPRRRLFRFARVYRGGGDG
jgi:hypothetical protein